MPTRPSPSFGRRLFSAALSLVAAVSIVGITPLVAGASTITLVSGGGAGAPGTADPITTYQIGAGSPGPALITNPDPAWSTIPGTRWVNTSGAPGTDAGSGSFGDCVSGGVTTDYTVHFTLADPPAGTSPSISVDVLGDNTTTVKLNGTQIGAQTAGCPTHNYTTVSTFTDPTASHFLQGDNTLVFSNTGYGGPNGVDFKATITYTPSADLAVSMSDEDPVLTDWPGNGDPIEHYTITVTNNGPSTAHNVMVTDSTASTLLDLRVSGDEGTCANPCNVGSIASGDSVDVIARVRPPSSAGIITNDASASADEADGNADNNSATENTQVVDFPDLSRGSTGLDHVWIGGPAQGTGPLSCQVHHDDVSFEDFAWNPTTDHAGFCGTYLSVNGQLYGPDGYGLTPPDVQHYRLVDQSAVDGLGTQEDPYAMTTTVDAGNSGIRLIETDTYVAGDESYRTDVEVQNRSESAQDFTLYRSADCMFPGGSDIASGVYDPATRTVGCVSSDFGTQASLTAITGGNHFVEAFVDDVFYGTGGGYYSPGNNEFSMMSGRDFPDTVLGPNDATDDAIGLSWSDTLQPLGSSNEGGPTDVATYSSSQVVAPYELTMTTNTPVVAPGGNVNYQVTLSHPGYPNDFWGDVNSVQVVLPDGFTYGGGEDGIFSDGTVEVDGNVVTFTGGFSLDYSEPQIGYFNATAGDATGNLNSSAYTIVGGSYGAVTGPTATVKVTNWEQVSPMPYSFSNFASATDPLGRFYVVGGNVSDGEGYSPTSSLELYTPSTDTWTTLLDNLPQTRTDAGAAFTNGHLYVIGGYNSVYEVSDQIFAYSPTSEVHWSTPNTLLDPRANAAVATGTNGKVYVFGGWDAAAHEMVSSEFYNPVTNQTPTAIADLPVGTASAAAVSYNGDIWIIGGTTNQDIGDGGTSDLPTSDVSIYDPIGDAYTSGPSLPQAVTGVSAFVANDGNLYVLGGDNGNHAVDSVYRYAGEGWETVDPMITSRSFFGAGASGAHIYAFGGIDENYNQTGSTEMLAVNQIQPQPPANLSISVDNGSTPAGFAAIDETGMNLAGASIDGGALVGSAGPQAAPLGKGPLGKGPLGKGPLGKGPLGKGPLGKGPLGKGPLGKGGLSDTLSPLRGASVSLLINHTIANPPLLNDMPIEVAGGWPAVLHTTVPLQTLTLNDAITSAYWSSVNIGDIDWSGTPFADFSSAAWLLGSARPADITGADWSGLTAQAGCTTSMTFTDLQLNRCDLTVVPWDQIPLSSVTVLADTPLEHYHLDGVLLNYTTLGEILVGDAPAGMVTCSGTACGPDLAHVQEIGGINPDATLSDFTNTQLSTVTLTTLLPAIADVTYYPFEAMTVAQLIAAADTSDQPTVTYSAEMDITCPGADGTTMTVQLPNARFRYVDGSGRFAIGPTTTPSGAPVNDGHGGLTFDLPGDACSSSGLIHVALTLDVVPGPNVGTFTAGLTASAPGFDDVGVTDHPASLLSVLESQENGDNATPIEPNTLYTGRVSATGDQDFFTIPLNPTDTPTGTRVAVYLSHLQQDDDLVLYGPSASAATLRPAPLGKGPLGKGSVDDNGSCLPSDYSVQPQTLQDVSVVSDPSTALRGFSTNRSMQEEISCTIVNEQDTGNLTVQVSGFNGTHGDSLYVLRYMLVPPPSSPACQTLPMVGGGTVGTMPSIPSSTQTLILWNAKRFGDSYGADAETNTLTSLTTLANSPLVNGKVIPVETNGAVATAYGALDDPQQPENACSPARANDVVRSINTFVDSLRTANNLTDLRFIVLVGSDNIVPFGRVPDLTALGNQSEYQGDVRLQAGLDNPISRAFAQGFVLSDDPYGSFSPIPWNGNQLYLPSVSTGRLVESPSEIQAQVTQFISSNGRLTPSSSLVTGYDFANDGATAVRTNLTASGIPGAILNTPPNWGTTDLTNQLTAASRGVISLNGHFDHYRSQLANGDIVSSSQLTTNVPMQGLLFTIGCNSGVSYPDVWVTSPVPNTLDWPQALSQRNGELVGNTGFGYGDDTTVAYSERLMALYAQNLNGSMSAGQALALAKAQYYSGLSAIGAYDLKVMEQSTYYGLPMYRMGAAGVIAGGSNPPAGPVTYAGHTAVAAGAVTTDGDTGLPVVNLAVPNFINPTADIRSGVPAANKYFVGPRTQVSQNRPIEPISDPIDMTKPNKILHDGLVTALTVDDSNAPFNPVMTTPTVDNSSNQPEPLITDVVFPTDFVSTSSVLGPFGRQDYLVIDGGRYVSNAGTPGTGTQRVYTQENVRAFYSNSDDSTRPQFETIDGFDVGGGSTAFSVDMQPDSLGDRNVAVYVMFRTIGGSNSFALRLLVETSPNHWSVTVGGDVNEYFIQAVDENGNVGVSTFKGLGKPITTTDTGGANVVVTGTQQGSWYTDSANLKISSNTGETFQAEVDGGPAAPVGPSGIDITGDGSHVVTFSGSLGSTGTQIVPIDSAAPQASLTLGDPKSGPPPYVGKTTPITIPVGDGSSGLATCTIHLTGPATSDQACSTAFSLTTGSGTYSARVQATDNAGHALDTSFTIELDADAPTVTIGVGSPSSPGVGTTFIKPSTNLTVDVGADARSGVDSCTISFSGTSIGSRACDPTSVTHNAFTLPTTDGPYTVSASGVDKVANSASTSRSITVDGTAPTFGSCPTLATPLYLGATQSITITASDGAGVGIDPLATQLTRTLNTVAVGTATATFTAADNLGNTATPKVCGYAVLYKFTGLFAPIDNIPVANVAKAGSTVPVKWKITDNSGTGIADTTSFTNLDSIGVSTGTCTGAPGDNLETYSTTSGLQYLGSGNWQFNWKTRIGYAGQCRTMVVTLKDGTTHTAIFQFK